MVSGAGEGSALGPGAGAGSPDWGGEVEVAVVSWTARRCAAGAPLRIGWRRKGLREGKLTFFGPA